MPPPPDPNNNNNNNNNNNHYNAYAQYPVDVGRIVADVRNSVESALRTVPPFSMPPMNLNLWGNSCPSNQHSQSSSSAAAGSSSSSSSGRPAIPAFPRDDEILVQVWTQAVKNSFNLKKSVNISTISGSIKAEIVPSPTPTTELFRKLTTHTNTGSTYVAFTTSLGPFMVDSSHSTMTGSIHATYPDDWCGTIELSITHGSYRLGDAIVVRDIVDQNTRERHILALRGNPREGEEFSTMKITSKTGSVNVSFDRLPPLRDLTDEEIRIEEDEARRRHSNTGFSALQPSPQQPHTQGGQQPGPNKEQKERGGVAVHRPGSTNTAPNYAPPATAPPAAQSVQHRHQSPPPNHHHQQQQAEVVRDPDDLPPSYEQSEQENVQIQIAGRD